MPQVGEIRSNPSNSLQKARWNGQVWEDVSDFAPQVGGGSIGGKAYYTQYGKKAAEYDIDELTDSKKMRNNANSMIEMANTAQGLLNKTPDLTGAWFKPAKDVYSKTGLNKERVADMGMFQNLAASGVLGNVHNLPGPLSDKDVRFLESTTYNPEDTPETNRAKAQRQLMLANKMKAYALEREKWIARYGSTRVPDEQGYSFDDRWDGWGSKKNFYDPNIMSLYDKQSARQGPPPKAYAPPKLPPMKNDGWSVEVIQ